jgi:hypothetical protein
MVGSGSMTALTTLVRRTPLCVEGCLPVWRFLPATVNFVVTGLAGVRSNILGNIGGRRAVYDRMGGSSTLIRTLWVSLREANPDKDEWTQNRKSENS